MASVHLVSGLALLLAGCTGGRSNAIDGGADAGAAACPAASITFALEAEHPEDLCIGAPNACINQWLFITAPDGTELVIDRPCSTECGACKPVGCPALCMAPASMQTGGEQRIWDGASYPPGVCGMNVSCFERSCAAAGRYTAKMCAYPRTSQGTSLPACMSGPTPTCTEVAFDWPPTSGVGTVHGLLGSRDGGADAGSCCPTDWLMYECTYSGGGAGMNCHNPAMGCASSATCGSGCDVAVIGRCAGGH